MENCKNSRKPFYAQKRYHIFKNVLNTLVVNRNKVNHNFDLNNATFTKREGNLKRKILEYRYIQNMNQGPGFFKYFHS